MNLYSCFKENCRNKTMCFSNEWLGTPCYVDSEGIARMLNRKHGNIWTPVCNTREHCKGKSNHYWIVGIHENPQQLRYKNNLKLPLLFFRTVLNTEIFKHLLKDHFLNHPLLSVSHCLISFKLGPSKGFFFY